MQGFSLGAGLAALAFWGFIASVVVGGMWYAIRERDAQHETVRRLMESGQPLDNGLVDKLLALSGEQNKRLDRDFLLGGWVVLGVGAGVAVFGLILGTQFPASKLPLLGVAALVTCIGLGLLVASKIAERFYSQDHNTASNRS